MGKRSKFNSDSKSSITESINTESSEGVSGLKKKRNSKSIVQPLNVGSKNKQKKKNFSVHKQQNIDILHEKSVSKEMAGIQERYGQENVQNKQTKGKNNPTKIIFVDDKPHEEPSSSSENKNKAIKNKNKPMNEDEADVKDDEIDKFCDELTEEDNEEYENWIKLLDAKLTSNKKT